MCFAQRKYSSLIQPLSLWSVPTLLNLGLNLKIKREMEKSTFAGLWLLHSLLWHFYTFKQHCGKKTPRAGFLLKAGTRTMCPSLRSQDHIIASGPPCWLIHHQLDKCKPQRPSFPTGCFCIGQISHYHSQFRIFSLKL